MSGETSWRLCVNSLVVCRLYQPTFIFPFVNAIFIVNLKGEDSYFYMINVWNGTLFSYCVLFCVYSITLKASRDQICEWPSAFIPISCIAKRRVDLISKHDNKVFYFLCWLFQIEDGEIFASINQKDGMVVFLDDSEKYNSPMMLLKIEEEMSNCIELDRQIQKMEEEILVNPQYVKKAFGAQEEDISAGQSSKISYSM